VLGQLRWRKHPRGRYNRRGTGAQAHRQGGCENHSRQPPGPKTVLSDGTFPLEHRPPCPHDTEPPLVGFPALPWHDETKPQDFSRLSRSGMARRWTQLYSAASAPVNAAPGRRGPRQRPGGLGVASSTPLPSEETAPSFDGAAQKKKARRSGPFYMVAGAGFEPATFGL
jgi:hypothetical protein